MPVRSLRLQLVPQQSFAELIPHNRSAGGGNLPLPTTGRCDVPGEQGLGPKPQGSPLLLMAKRLGCRVLVLSGGTWSSCGTHGGPLGCCAHDLISAPFTPGCCGVQLGLQILLISQVMGGIAQPKVPPGPPGTAKPWCHS